MSKTASTAQEVHKKLKNASGHRVKGNLILTKPEIRLLVEDREQMEAEHDYLRYLLNFRHKGIECKEQRLRWLLDQSPSERIQTPVTKMLFESMVLQEMLRLAVKTCVDQAGANHLNIDATGSGIPGFYTALKPNMKLLKLPFDTELKWATRLSLWVGKQAEPQPVFAPRRNSVVIAKKKGAKNGRRPTGAALSRSTEFVRKKQSASEMACNRLIDTHEATREFRSELRNDILEDKVGILLDQLETVKNKLSKLERQNDSRSSVECESVQPLYNQREYTFDSQNFEEQDFRSESIVSPEYLPPSILFNNDLTLPISEDVADDVPNLCQLRTETVIKMLDNETSYDSGPKAKKRITSPDSQDLLCLVVAKKLNDDGEWQKLYTKLMCMEKQRFPALDILEDITAIEKKYPTEETRAFRSLRSWRQAIGGQLNIFNLNQTLEGIRRSDIVKDIIKYENRLTQNTNNVGNNFCALCKTVWS